MVVTHSLYHVSPIGKCVASIELVYNMTGGIQVGSEAIFPLTGDNYHNNPGLCKR